MNKTVDVFCSSSDQVSPIYFSEMENLARGLAENKIDIVYGGANVGLMGRLATVALKFNGRVTGVIPEYLNTEGIVHSNLSELIVVGNLMDRKRRMAELSDFILAFPGGIGTIDEVTEALALKQLGELDKPILFLNFLNFWDPFFSFLEELQHLGMIRQSFGELFRVFEQSEEVVEFISKR